MRYADFEQLVRRLSRELPAEFLDGVAAIEVSPKTLPHPIREDVYTLGECIPVPVEAGPGAAELQSRVVLYHGSFQALAKLNEEFDWRTEAWETLTHELRHHLEWRAGRPDLEAYDDAAEANFARGDGAPFDPEFHLAAEPVADGVYRLDDDYFLDQTVGTLPPEVRFSWHGRDYLLVPPQGTTLPAFLTVHGVAEPPPGELILVLRQAGGWRALFRPRPIPFQGAARACPAGR